MAFLHIYSDGCNGFRRCNHLLTRVPKGYFCETPGVWVNEGGESFYIEVPTGNPVEPKEEEEEEV